MSIEAHAGFAASARRLSCFAALQTASAERCGAAAGASDWSIAVPLSCRCALCAELSAFPTTAAHQFSWPLAKYERQHIHQILDGHHLPVAHETTRHGRPYTLVLTKQQALFSASPPRCAPSSRSSLSISRSSRRRSATSLQATRRAKKVDGCRREMAFVCDVTCKEGKRCSVTSVKQRKGKRACPARLHLFTVLRTASSSGDSLSKRTAPFRGGLSALSDPATTQRLATHDSFQAAMQKLVRYMEQQRWLLEPAVRALGTFPKKTGRADGGGPCLLRLPRCAGQRILDHFLLRHGRDLAPAETAALACLKQARLSPVVRGAVLKEWVWSFSTSLTDHDGRVQVRGSGQLRAATRRCRVRLARRAWRSAWR